MSSPRRGQRRDRTQALILQRLLVDAAQEPDCPAAAKASCATAWSRVQEARRIIEGKPLPGQLRPDLAQASSAKRLGPPARVAQRVVVLPKPAGPAEPASTTPVVPQQSMLVEPASPEATGG